METPQLPPPLAPTTIGLGTMQLTGPRVLGPPPDWASAVSLLRTALELGVELFDSAWYYGPDVTHRLLVDAFGATVKGLTIVTKAGNSRGLGGSWVPALNPKEITAAVERDLRHLHLDALPLALLRWHPLPGDISNYMDSIGTMAALQRAGHILELGLSNVTLNHITAALSVTHVAAVSNAYSLYNRRDLLIVKHCATQGIPFLPYYPLMGGEVAQRTILQRISMKCGLKPAQLAIAWLKAQPGTIIPIAGTSQICHLQDNVVACRTQLPRQLLAELDDTITGPTPPLYRTL